MTEREKERDRESGRHRGKEIGLRRKGRKVTRNEDMKGREWVMLRREREKEEGMEEWRQTR